MKTKPTILLLASMLAATVCFAGTAWRYKCETPKCGFAGHLNVGGGFIYGQVAGYCSTCKKFVAIGWKRKGLSGNLKKQQDKAADLREHAPEKVGTVWNPATGLMADLFPCPECKKPFMAVDEISLGKGVTRDTSDKFCPKCEKLSLTFKKIGNFD